MSWKTGAIVVVVASLIAGALICAQGCAVWAFIRFVRSFGDYTESQRAFTKSLMEVHASNVLLHERTVELIEAVKRSQQKTEMRVTA